MTTSAVGQKRWDAPRIVTSYCSGCHGIDGNAQLPYFPKIAGLDPKYAEKKLSAFKEPFSPPVDELFSVVAKLSGTHNDPGNVSHEERINMEGVAHAAKPEVINEAVLWYAKQVPTAGHSANKLLIQEGKDLFMHGVPAQKVLPCMTCHGVSAQGQGLAPSLAGQNGEYIEGQLAKFRRGDRTHAPEMTMVTRDLDDEQARAAAAYLQSR
ncbi:MAG TPA: c-type cytochrome [Bryobacteraceae bacterium]|nr:c-type cytochrome [Bryobacteraceae bacterium]